jgi:hypothetical protein
MSGNKFVVCVQKVATVVHVHFSTFGFYFEIQELAALLERKPI